MASLFRAVRCAVRQAPVFRSSVALSQRTYYTYSNEPSHPLPNRTPKWQTAEEALEVLGSNMRVFVHGGASTPLDLLSAMVQHGTDSNLKNVEVIHIHTEGEGAYMKPECEGMFRTNNMFCGSNARKPVAEGRADFMPIFLSEIPLLFRRNILNVDVALISVSPPDMHGFCTLGASVDIVRAAIQNARWIVAQINPHVPRSFGDGVIHVSHFDTMVEADHPLPLMAAGTLASPEEVQIGKNIADTLVDDGATLQMGIGSIPDAVLAELKNHRDLGIHTEMFSDRVLDLVNVGAITNHKKTIIPGKIVSSFVLGSRKVMDFLNDNPFIVLCDISFVNSTAVISQNPKVTAINSCIELDITGQIVSDSIGTRIYSGVGGQVDFIRGAALGLDGKGKPIIALTSTTSKGESKIVPTIKEGGGVVTTRAHSPIVVTEYGIAYLFGKNLRQRAKALIDIAHPDHREWLEQCAFERLKCMPSYR